MIIILYQLENLGSVMANVLNSDMHVSSNSSRTVTSLLDNYLWERHELPYLASNGLKSTVLESCES